MPRGLQTYGLPTLFGDDSVYTELEGVDGGGWRSTAFGYEVGRMFHRWPTSAFRQAS
jgi:hypothetical protein